MSVEERARLVLDPDMDKAIRALLSVIDTEKKVGDEAKSVAAKREQIEAEFSKKAFDLSHNRVEILKKEFSESLAEAEKYGAKRESIEKYYNKAINDARADALATQGQKLSQMGGALTLGVTTPLVAAGVAGLKFAASMESSAVKYGVLLGDMSKGIPFTEELKKLAAQTPLAFQGLDQAAQTLLGFQVSSDGLTDTLRMLGDLAKGNSEKLQGVALAYGQMSAAGRANMQDLNQLINAGVPILGALATSMGKPVPEIRKMVEEGKVGFSDVDKALKGLVDEGGLFHDMMKKVAETAEGKLSTALDSLKDAAGSAMESLIPLAKDLLEGVTGAAEKFSALDENSRRAILTILGMAAVSGPIMTATGGVMQLVAAYQKLDKAALVAKLTMLASNPVGWAIAGAAAIAGGIALINKAERDHEKALRDKAGAYKETAAEGAALAKEYQTLYDKTKLSADEQKRMVDLAQILKEKYPDLTQDTLNLAAANKTLADKVDEAALATARKAAGELLPKVESRYTQAVKELGNFSQILEKLKKLPDGGTYLGISKAETKTYEGYVAALRDEVAALQSDIETYKETLYGIPKNPNAKPIITPPSSG
ncbi:MAG: tape measure protein, partial [Spirochaetia bacterium]|nr:tape measure protein [Spirochaetia bacterium]